MKLTGPGRTLNALPGPALLSDVRTPFGQLDHYDIICSYDLHLNKYDVN